MDKQKAIDKAGGVQKLADLLGIRHQAVTGWADRVPEMRVYQLKVLRPEWFAKGKRKAA